jgi:hypothetical protein
MAASEKDAGSYQQRGSDVVRDTAKWVAVALASVGAVIIAGLQLADLRNLALPALDPQYRMYVAAAGVVLGLGGVGLAIYAVATVLTPQHVTLERLHSHDEYKSEREFFATNQEFLRGFGKSVDDLKGGYRKRHEAYVKAREDHEANPKDQNALAAMTQAANALKPVHETVLEVLRVASYERIRRLFRCRLKIVFFFAFVSATGGAIFAWATGKSTENDPASLFADRVTIELPPSHAASLKSDLGANCDAGNLSAVILADEDGTLDALVLPINQCSLLRLSLPAGTAKIRSKTMIERKTAK